MINEDTLNENIKRLLEVMELTNDDLLIEEKKKADRCLKIARRKYDKPSAYRSGAIVRCRNGKIWKDLKEDDINEAPEDIKELLYKAHESITKLKGNDHAPDINELEEWVHDEIDNMSMNEYSSEGEGWDDDEIEIERDGNIISVKTSIGDEVRYKGHKGKVVKTEYDGVRVNFPSIGENGLTMHFYYEDLNSKEGYYQAVDESLNEAKKTDYSKEKKDGLHGWFSRRGGGGNKGWVDCNTCKTVDGKKKCKACGREKGEKRAKYPSCRPTPASCGTPGKGKKWGKTKKESFDPINEDIEKIKQMSKLITEAEAKIKCTNCGWSWNVKDGGDDLYMCHKCGHDNSNELTQN